MFKFPKTERGLRSRIIRYRASLTSERKYYGAIDDGNGTRYVIFWLLFLLNDPHESKKYMRWYKKNFPDDVGEAIQKLCAALMFYRMQKLIEADHMLADLMLCNPYMIPFVTGTPGPPKKHGQRSWAEEQCEEAFPPEIQLAITPGEKVWMAERYTSPEFIRLRTRYAEVEAELEQAIGLTLRIPLVKKLNGLLRVYRSGGQI
ncbi:MAG: hypothetical protein ACI9TH_003531 [Kiritimatiellia bacterium]|jgi:hypothetical protein